MKNLIFGAFLLMCSSLCGIAQNNINLIPYPQQLTQADGHFLLSANVKITSGQEALFANEIAYMHSVVSSCGSASSKGEVELAQTDDIANAEGYTLSITPRKITLSAATPAGMFYAVQTLNQLIELNRPEGGQPVIIPALNIVDEPAFVWRGSMLDVSRHFYTIDYIKQHIDRLAFYKMNRFHIHLTDDQGWRMEIRKYPELTAKGAFRTFNDQDSACIKLAKENSDFEIDPRFIRVENGKQIYGGYYTQEELKALVKYAAERHVEIIPEIDMPGHMMAAIAAYPELTDGKTGWGDQFSVPVCPCKEGVYTFIDDVLEEVKAVFPSDYIHIGADEVEKTTWKESELCRQLMADEGIENVNALQSYFVHRVQDIAQAKGKKIIAWDEALEGGVNQDVTIMYWRGWVPGAPRKATTNGSKVIMSPTNPLYFDTFPNKSSLRNVYDMKVVYDDIPADAETLILGAQANLWAERIPSENRADFLLFPRLTALAERVWTNADRFDDYSKRLLSHFPILERMNVAYRMPDLCGFAFESVYVGEGLFDVQSPLNGKYIHYTTDGTLPSKHSPVLKEPMKIDRPVTIKFALFGDHKAKGDIYTVNYESSTFAKPATDMREPKPGLRCEFFNQRIDKVAKISGEADKHFATNNIVVPAEAKAPQFGLRYTGYIDVPETGIYSFFLTCDDAGMLYIADRLVVDNEGPHSPLEKSGQVALAKGRHPFRLDFVEGGGGYTLLLQYSEGGCEVKDIPDNWFTH